MRVCEWHSYVQDLTHFFKNKIRALCRNIDQGRMGYAAMYTMANRVWFPVQVAQRRIDHRIHIKGKDIADPITSFEQLERQKLIQAALLRNVKQAGYTAPTPIQMQAIPILLQGRETLACAPTGSGMRCHGSTNDSVVRCLGDMVTRALMGGVNRRGVKHLLLVFSMLPPV